MNINRKMPGKNALKSKIIDGVLIDYLNTSNNIVP